MSSRMTGSSGSTGLSTEEVAAMIDYSVSVANAWQGPVTIPFIPLQADYSLPSAPKANSVIAKTKGGQVLDEGVGNDFTISGNTLQLNLASPICSGLTADDAIIVKYVV